VVTVGSIPARTIACESKLNYYYLVLCVSVFIAAVKFISKDISIFNSGKY